MKTRYQLIILMFISSTGLFAQDNIEINKTGDAYILLNADMNGNSTEDNNAYIKFSQDGSAIKGIIGTVGNAGKDPENNNCTGTLTNAFFLGALHQSSSHPALQFGTDDKVRMTILPDGNIGIGTTEPSRTLHVVAPENTWKARFSGSDGYIDIGPANSGWAHIYTDRPKFIFNKDIYSITGGFSAYNSAKLYLKTNGTTRLTINTDGKIGIGTDVPEETFQLKGNTCNILLDNTAETESGIIFRDNQDISGHQVAKILYNSNTTDDNKLNFYNNDLTNPRLTIAYNGNIGIGIVNPQNKLDVNGTIHAREVKINLDGWSDFVFSDDYNLRSLEETEVFICENGHLPDIPSAAQVEEEGISIGEMNAKLLQKIEELTLYNIEMNKQLKMLVENNKRLENEIESLKNTN